jgi:hypothetical protein
MNATSQHHTIVGAKAVTEGNGSSTSPSAKKVEACLAPTRIDHSAVVESPVGARFIASFLFGNAEGRDHLNNLTRPYNKQELIRLRLNRCSL